MQQHQEQEVDEQGNAVVLALERKSVQNFRDQDEYIYAMKEDLAEWFNTLYSTAIDVENFMEEIENGVLICNHANKVQEFIAELIRNGEITSELFHQHQHSSNAPSSKQKIDHKNPDYAAVKCRATAGAGTFQARDNISNFIAWCRKGPIMNLGDAVLFETEDLVARKNQRNVILCLLEVARRGARYGMEAPGIIQLEQEIDAEIQEEEEQGRGEGGGGEGQRHEEEEQEEEEVVIRPLPVKIVKPVKPRERWVNDLMSLDEMVRELVNRCSCPDQFPVIRVSEGKYKVGDSLQLIFVRILRNHVMVRIGGGWDTLENFLNRHDPCRCNTKGSHKTPMKRRASAPFVEGHMELKTKSIQREEIIEENGGDTVHHNSSRRQSAAPAFHTPQSQTPSRQLPKTPTQPSRLLKTPQNRSNNNNNTLGPGTGPRRASIHTTSLSRNFTSSGSLDQEQEAGSRIKGQKINTPKRPSSAAAIRRSSYDYNDDEDNESVSSDTSLKRGAASGVHRGSRLPQNQHPSKQSSRSRSVGPIEARRELNRGQNSADDEAATGIILNDPDMLMVSRDGTGGHRVGPMVAGGTNGNGNGHGYGNGNGNGSSQMKGGMSMSKARMAITPNRLLPDKIQITRQSSAESDLSSPMSSDRSGSVLQGAGAGAGAGANGRLQRGSSVSSNESGLTTPTEESAQRAPQRQRQRNLSESICIDDSHLDDIPDIEPDPELHQHMELLFSEYMKIERCNSRSSSRATSPGPSQQEPVNKPLPVHITKKDLSKVKSRLADYISGKKDAPGSSASRPQTPRKGSLAGTSSMANTSPMGFRRPASACSTPRRGSLQATTRFSGSQDNMLDQDQGERGRNRVGVNRAGAGSRGTSPAPNQTRRKLPAAPTSAASVPTSPMSSQPQRPSSAAGGRRDSGVIGTATGRMVRSKSVTRVEMFNNNRDDSATAATPTRVSRQRPTTPTSSSFSSSSSRARPTTPTGNRSMTSASSTFRSTTPQPQGRRDNNMCYTMPAQRPSSAAAGRLRASRENLLDSSTTSSTAAQQRNSRTTVINTPNKTPAARSKSRDAVCRNRTAETNPEYEQYPWRKPRNANQSAARASPEMSMNTTEEELNNTLAQIQDYVRRPCELSLLDQNLVVKAPEEKELNPEQHTTTTTKLKTPECVAKPRTAKIQEGRTRIPKPIGSKETQPQVSSLKRYDSGVDINVNDSPSENSIHDGVGVDTEERLPWHQSADSGLQYSSGSNGVQNAEQEYF